MIVNHVRDLSHAHEASIKAEDVYVSFELRMYILDQKAEVNHGETLSHISFYSTQEIVENPAGVSRHYQHSVRRRVVFETGFYKVKYLIYVAQWFRRSTRTTPRHWLGGLCRS